MPVALLMRGHANREPHKLRPWGVDWRRCFDSQYKYLIEPLTKLWGEIDTFLSTYDDPNLGSVEWTYRSFRPIVNPPDSTQKRTALAGLNSVFENFYDYIVVCRFDLELKVNLLQHPNFNPHKVNFLWREWKKETWEDHRRVADAIHIIPGRFLQGFRNGIEDTPSENCLHLIYRPVAGFLGEKNLNILYDGFLDSNSDVQENPVYTMIRVK